jgi:hypothetical protein
MSTTSRLCAIQTETFAIRWSVSGNVPFSAKPVVSHDDLYVYTTRENGIISAFDMKNGEEVWNVTCEDIQNTANMTESTSRAARRCVDLIEAEGSIAPNGLVYFYGDKFGNVKALQLGDSTIPTASPSYLPTFSISESPSEYLDTIVDSNIQKDAPIVDPSMPQYPNGESTFRPSLAPVDWAELMYRSSAGKLPQKCLQVYASILFATFLALGF